MSEPAPPPIPFGTSRPPASWMTQSDSGADSGAELTIRVPCVTVTGGRDGALRLNRGIDAKPEPAGTERLAGPRASLARHCDPWRPSQGRFLACYLDFVSRHVESERAALAEGLRRFAGVFDYRDWVYSALTPLPRAHLHAPDSGEKFGPETLVRVDFALWTGEAAIAIEIAGASTRSPATDRRHARLGRAGVRIVELTPDLLEPGRGAAFDAALPDELRHFWRHQALPSGPLRPTALDVGIDEI